MRIDRVRLHEQAAAGSYDFDLEDPEFEAPFEAPRLTPSMRTALQDLGLEALCVVYPGRGRYALAERVEAVPLEALVPG